MFQILSNVLVHVSNGCGEGGAIMRCQKDRYTLIQQLFNFRITCMQYSQKEIYESNDQKNN